VNVTLFSRVALIRKLQLTSDSDLDHFHAHDLPCSRVKSRDDPISDCRVDGTVPYSFIYTVSHNKTEPNLYVTLSNINKY